MSNRIITVSREFGSGGRTIGRMAALKLGIPCYDQELIDKVAAESGLVREFVAEHSEDIRGGWFGYAGARDFYGRSINDTLYAAQTKVIR